MMIEELSVVALADDCVNVADDDVDDDDDDEDDDAVSLEVVEAELDDD